MNARLANEKNIWLAVTRADGRPHLSPIWFVWHDDAFWVCTDANSVKSRALRGNPRASVSLEDGNAPMVAECTAIVHERPYPEALIGAFMAKFGWNIRGDVPDADGPFDALIELRPAKWLFDSSPI